jgi:hypothetical protein
MDTLDELYSFLSKKSRTPFDDNADFNQRENCTDFSDYLNWLWKQDWPVAKKMYNLGYCMYMLGIQDAQDSIHPCVLDILQEIDRLDDQGIDVIGIQAQLIPRMRDHRPEQMAKWPIIFKN